MELARGPRRSDEDSGKLDQDPVGRVLLILVRAALVRVRVLQSMCCVVFVEIGGREEDVQVIPDGSVRVEPRGLPTQRRPEGERGQKEDEEQHLLPVAAPLAFPGPPGIHLSERYHPLAYAATPPVRCD